MSTDLFMDDKCFACGKSNEQGLQLHVERTEQGVIARFQIPAWGQGYKDMVHGGIVSTVLDEIAVWAAYMQGCKCVTAQLTVRIKQPLHTRTMYIASGKVMNIKHRFVHACAQIVNPQDTVMAIAQAKLMRMA